MERKTTDGEGLLHRDKIAGRRTAAAEQNKGIQEDRDVQQEFFSSEVRGAQHGLPETLQSTQTEAITCITGLASGEVTAETTAEATASCSGAIVSNSDLLEGTQNQLIYYNISLFLYIH